MIFQWRFKTHLVQQIRYWTNSQNRQSCPRLNSLPLCCFTLCIWLWCELWRQVSCHINYSTTGSFLKILLLCWIEVCSHSGVTVATVNKISDQLQVQWKERMELGITDTNDFIQTWLFLLLKQLIATSVCVFLFLLKYYKAPGTPLALKEFVVVVLTTTKKNVIVKSD